MRDGARIRELTVIRALLKRGDPREALRQAEAATEALRWRREPPAEQLRLPRLPLTLVPRREEPSPLKGAKPDCRTCPHRAKKPQPKPVSPLRLGHACGAYTTPFGRVQEAFIAWEELATSAATEKECHAAKERLRNACVAWLRREPVGEKG